MAARRRQHEGIPRDHLALDIADLGLQREQRGASRSR